MVVVKRSLAIHHPLYSLLCIITLAQGSCIPSQGDYSYTTNTECTSEHIKEALSSHSSCKPRPVVMVLPWPNNTSVHQMTPTQVEVYQCDGGCHHSSKECKPTKTRMKKVPVILGKCGLGAGRCDKECAHTIIEEHLECGCECGIKREECESATHRYRPEVCECECRDYEGKMKCLNQGRSWSDKTCSCGCPQDYSCPVGARYDDAQCICLLDEKEITNNKQSDDMIEDEKVNDFITREIIVIILLLVINICLLTIVASLWKRLQIVRTRLRIATIETISDDYKEIYKYDNSKDDALMPAKLINYTYSELDIHSASSGFGSEVSKPEDFESDSAKTDMENIYETAESVQLKKKTKLLFCQEKREEKESSVAYSRAMQSIDETLKLLQESAEKL